MSFHVAILWTAAGFLGLTALTMMLEPDAPVMSLESGLGEQVVTSRL